MLGASAQLGARLWKAHGEQAIQTEIGDALADVVIDLFVPP